MPALEPAMVRERALALFDCLDRNRNGELELDDLASVAARLERIAPELVHTEVATAWVGLFRQIQAGAPGGGRVSREHFAAFFERAGQHTASQGWVPMEAMAWLDATLDALDLDGDGRISAPEYAAWLTALGSDADAVDAFVRLDLDGDGFLDLGELEQLFAEWLTGGATARGAVLLTGRS